VIQVLWKKLGRIYTPNGEQGWARTHAFIPTSVMLDEDCIRVYAAFLDRDKVGRVGYVDLEARNPLRVLKASDKPALDVGDPGTFDDSGVTPVCIVAHQGRLYLYYIGWQLGVKVRYYLFIGLAVSADGGETFTRCSQVPILDRSDLELYVRSAACVLYDEGQWKMWYVAGDEWTMSGGKQVPTYNMRYLESTDKAEWGNEGLVCLDLAASDEYGFGRPYVIKEGGLYRMWYSIRSLSQGYRLGYAESPDGINWTRKDAEVGIDVSEAGWDSEMICCSCIQKTKYGTYMFYNGNNYGETGFGAAVLEA
jgi:hypothetical protein